MQRSRNFAARAAISRCWSSHFHSPVVELSAYGTINFDGSFRNVGSILHNDSILPIGSLSGHASLAIVGTLA